MAGILSNGVVIRKFVAPTSIISNQPVFVADSISLKRSTNSQNAQRWEIQTRLEPSTNSADMLIHSVLNGFGTSFDIQMPQPVRSKENSSTTTSVPLVSISANAGSSVVLLTNNNGKIAKGEFIRFQNHSKVYLVTETLNLNGTLSIYPSLRENVTQNTPILYGNATTMRGYYNSETTIGIVYEDGILSDQGTVTIVEDL